MFDRRFDVVSVCVCECENIPAFKIGANDIKKAIAEYKIYSDKKVLFMKNLNIKKLHLKSSAKFILVNVMNLDGKCLRHFLVQIKKLLIF